MRGSFFVRSGGVPASMPHQARTTLQSSADGSDGSFLLWFPLLFSFFVRAVTMICLLWLIFEVGKLRNSCYLSARQ
ncbi:MAG: hypothetical protein EAZ81_03260 [Verrucomicrobia bacterium]|nr:MAG: hypothetical protein EAZ81_03260 [Verrucomicrobiota bacterium]